MRRPTSEDIAETRQRLVDARWRLASAKDGAAAARHQRWVELWTSLLDVMLRGTALS